MAATAAFLDRPPIRISAPSTPARTHKPLLARPPARTSPITFPAATCPPAISAPPSDASSPPSLKVKSNPKPPPPSPISAKPSCKPCPSPSTNTSTPTAPTPGAKPSASPTNSPPITSSLIHHRQRQRQSPNRNRLQPQPQPLLPRRHQTHLPPPSKIVTAHLWSLSSRSGRSLQAAEKVAGAVTGEGLAASKKTCADTMSSRVACSVTFRRINGYRRIIRCAGYAG